MSALKINQKISPMKVKTELKPRVKRAKKNKGTVSPILTKSETQLDKKKLRKECVRPRQHTQHI